MLWSLVYTLLWSLVLLWLKGHVQLVTSTQRDHWLRQNSEFLCDIFRKQLSWATNDGHCPVATDDELMVTMIYSHHTPSQSITITITISWLWSQSCSESLSERPVGADFLFVIFCQTEAAGVSQDHLLRLHPPIILLGQGHMREVIPNLGRILFPVILKKQTALISICHLH